ncbi:kinetochore protein spc25 isoform X2 [Amborella trichopoda]|uniref:kinetochore protein spc25 isoform X2 n=1 Tax=Amborella trichopoda TaxID=13333 RepID=UPI0005D30174|nr:kinetochore protein spc25 isoform X2 [Amborella trichopoda]|eukprot:XP_011622077.1 kinetochore protein spc25 isoform X2 [Amborella trichopoda]
MQMQLKDLCLNCVNEAEIQEKRVNSAKHKLSQLLESCKTAADSSVETLVKIGKLKERLRELEDGLDLAEAKKANRNSQCESITESISAAKARNEELKNIIQNQRAKKDEYATIISRVLLASETLEEMNDQNISYRKGQEGAVQWYNRFLGFRIEAGHGIKFIFNKVDPRNPEKEFSFTVRHWQDKYYLQDCDPNLEGTDDLLRELNQTNCLFKFVRVMREKFRMAALLGNSDIHESTPRLEQSSVSISFFHGRSKDDSVQQLEGPEQPSKRFLDTTPKRVPRSHGSHLVSPSPEPESAYVKVSSRRRRLL